MSPSIRTGSVSTAPGCAFRARLIASSTCADAPSALGSGASRWRRSRRSGSGCSKRSVTTSFASSGVMPPTGIPEIVTPGGISGAERNRGRGAAWSWWWCRLEARRSRRCPPGRQRRARLPLRRRARRRQTEPSHALECSPRSCWKIRGSSVITPSTPRASSRRERRAIVDGPDEDRDPELVTAIDHRLETDLVLQRHRRGSDLRDQAGDPERKRESHRGEHGPGDGNRGAAPPEVEPPARIRAAAARRGSSRRSTCRLPTSLVLATARSTRPCRRRACTSSCSQPAPFMSATRPTSASALGEEREHVLAGSPAPLPAPCASVRGGASCRASRRRRARPGPRPAPEPPRRPGWCSAERGRPRPDGRS